MGCCFDTLGCVSEPQEPVDSAEYAATFTLEANGNSGGAEMCLLDCELESPAAQNADCALL